MKTAKIVGTGMHVPDRVVTNEELAKWMKTSPDWIEGRTGIKERRWVQTEQGPSDLALPAAEQALAAAGWNKEDIELVIFATLSNDIMFPGSGCLFQEKFGLGTTPALDIRNQCTGFLYGLAIAQQFCRTGMYKKVLLIGAEVHSTGLDVTTEGRNVSVIFGDGAAAVCIAGGDFDSGIGNVYLHSDGAGKEHLMVTAPTTVSHPIMTVDMLNAKMHTPHMDGPVVFRHAIQRLEEVANKALADNDLTVDDIDMVIPHQANMRINALVANRLGIPEGKVYHNIQRYGNTTAASIPIALHEAVQEGLIQEGSKVMLLAFGAGFTWGAAIIDW